MTEHTPESRETIWVTIRDRKRDSILMLNQGQYRDKDLTQYNTVSLDSPYVYATASVITKIPENRSALRDYAPLRPRHIARELAKQLNKRLTAMSSFVP